MGWVTVAMIVIVVSTCLDLALMVWCSSRSHPDSYIRKVRQLVAALGAAFAAALVYNLALLLETHHGLPAAGWLRRIRYTELVYLVSAVAAVQLWWIVRLEGFRPLDQLLGQAHWLRETARRDSLTHLLHHEAFYQELGWVIAHRRYPCTVIVMDVDNFRQFNDQFGHPVGDDVLRRVAAVLRRELRYSDIVGRIGGEEFAVVLPYTPEPLGFRVAERVRAAVAQVQVSGRRITVSVGVVCYAGHHKPPSARELVEAADRAMYAAKRAGKNRVVAGPCAL